MARDSDAPKYNSEGYNKRGRRKIGYKPRTESAGNAYAGVNANYALQNRNIPAFSDPSNPNGGLTAQQWGGQLRSRGMGIGPGGDVFATRGPGGPRLSGRGPMQPQQFREGIRRRQEQPMSAPADTLGSVRPMNFGAELGAGRSPAEGGGLLSGGGGVAPMAVPMPSEAVRLPTISPGALTPEQNRARLQSMVDGKKLLDSVQNPSPVFQSSPEAIAGGQPNSVLRGKYGTGGLTMLTPEQQANRPEATIGGQPASQFFADAADRQGVDNKFAKTSSMDPKKWREALAKKNLTKPTSRPV